MSWCPKCKIEYREGIEVCADCGTELVDALPADDDYVCVFQSDNKPLTDKLSAYLVYSKIENSIRELTDESNETVFAVYVPPEKFKKAKKACNAFATVEAEIKAKEIIENLNSTDESALYDGATEDNDCYDSVSVTDAVFENTSDEDDLSGTEQDYIENDRQSDAKKLLHSQNNVYVKKSEQSKDLKSTAITFFVFAIMLSGFFVINFLEIITVFSSTISLICLALLSVGCLFVGINSLNRAKKASAEAVEEDKLTSELNKWLSENVDEDLLIRFDKEDLTEEANYIERTEGIKNMMTNAFGEIDEDYLDNIIEDFYNRNFE